jgi:hypothetical protein
MSVNPSINPSRLEKLLWWCAGADRDLLTDPMGCPPSDRVKFFGMGGIVLATGFLAFLSSSFAFYTIFAPKGDAVQASVVDPNKLAESIHYPTALAACVFGILWGLMIFNLDRFIISAGGKGDMKEGISLKDLGQAWPRLGMAIILGIVISAPLEIRIMKTEIDAELSKRQENYEFKLNVNSDSLIDAKKKSILSRLSPLEKQLKDNQEYVEKRRLEIKEQRKQLELEAEGKTGSATAGRGPAWRDKKENLDKMEVELDNLAQRYAGDEQTLKQRIQALEKEIAGVETERADRQKKNKERAHSLDGLVERIKISHEIGGLIPIFIMLMFIVIEITPILFKMMMTKTPYDYLSENKNQLIYAKNGIAFHHEPHRDASGKEIEIITYDAAQLALHKKQKENDLVRQQIDNYSPDTDQTNK